ncbi:uncharacterized protein [Amphiura filiformis]|uniref:uncharacterized protein n=1 Tax=Amphiura filiformis TaxID=82378 RepID=UPI003B224E1B
MANASSTISASTRGGADYDDLIRGTVKYYSFNLVDLAHYMTLTGAKQRLVQQIDDTFADILTQQDDMEIECFTIGKSHARRAGAGGSGYSKRYKKFNRMNKYTWSLDGGVSGRWSSYYSKKGYSGLVVLTAVTRDIIPRFPTQVRQARDAEEYSIALEQELIEYYSEDPLLANVSFNTGPSCDTTPHAGIVYVAYKLKKKRRRRGRRYTRR